MQDAHLNHKKRLRSSYSGASKGEAIVNYCEPIETFAKRIGCSGIDRKV